MLHPALMGMALHGMHRAEASLACSGGGNLVWLHAGMQAQSEHFLPCHPSEGHATAALTAGPLISMRHISTSDYRCKAECTCIQVKGPAEKCAVAFPSQGHGHKEMPRDASGAAAHQYWSQELRPSWSNSIWVLRLLQEDVCDPAWNQIASTHSVWTHSISVRLTTSIVARQPRNE